MAPGIYGADIEQLRALSKSLGQSGTRLKTVESTVSTLVQSAIWKGEDGARFRNEWTSSLRPMLNRTSESLQQQARSLLVHADEQDQASNSTAGAGSGPGASQPGPGQPTPGPAAPERQWTDAFTDPNYEHAPAGLEWLLEKWIDDGSGASDITSALQLVADKFSWNIDLADAAPGTSKFFDGMRSVGKGLVVLGAALGVLDFASGLENRDPFRMADGAVGGGLAIAAGIAAATGVGLPVAAAIGAAGLVWGFASLVSGDVPVTKRIWDFGAGVVGGARDLAGGAVNGVKDLANGVQDAFGWAGGKLGFG
jgi:hypothetical protein